MGKTETAQERAFTVRRITLKRVIDVTGDGSDFIVADTKSVKYAVYVIGCIAYKALSILYKAGRHGQKRKI